MGDACVVLFGMADETRLIWEATSTSESAYKMMLGAAHIHNHTRQLTEVEQPISNHLSLI